MAPVDPRLLRFGRTTRRYIGLTVVIGTVSAGLVVAQAGLIARAVSGAFIGQETLVALRPVLVALLAVVVGRAVLAWASEVAANRASARVKSQLRRALVERVAVVGADGLGARRPGEVASLATRGVDALDGYFARYVPQLVLAVIVPVTVLVVVWRRDWISAAVIAITLPLIPVFMALIGMATRRRTDRQLHTLQRLSGHFLDVVAGLPTLKVFGRSQAQVATIRDVTDRYRRATMGTLRLAFLSSLVLEFLASIAVALVAVSVGLRLLHGHLGLEASLFVLILAPEAYLPIRLVGANYHASAEGLSAAEQLFDLLDSPAADRGTVTDVPDPSVHALIVDGLWVSYPGREAPALAGVSLTVEPGEVLTVVGPSGAGKSTLLGVLLGFVVPQAGAVHIGGVDLATIDADVWRSRLTWVPQRPHLFSASLEANIRLGRPDAPAGEVIQAVADAGLTDVVARLPDGLATPIGERGARLSVGERRRVALARAFLRDAPLLLLDEPTAGLDGATETEVLAAIRRLARGRSVVVVSHRPAVLELGGRVVELTREPVAA